MNFLENYNSIKKVITEELYFLEAEITGKFQGENPLDKKLLEFLTAPSKRVRPLLAYLFLKNISEQINSNQHKVLLAVELIHNATLIHDDVIDNCEKRRSQKTINAQFDDNLAVVAGDYLLSVSMQEIIDTKSIEVFEIFANALKKTCLGEINQYFNKFNITSIENYIEKSKEKTAMLFQTAITAGVILSNGENDGKIKNAAKEFSQNFGIAFQIRDDLINVLNSDKLKPSSNDFASGIYTAPIIFAYQEDKNILENPNIDKINTAGGIAKTISLMDNYFDKARTAIDCFEETKYKTAILSLIELLRNNL